MAKLGQLLVRANLVTENNLARALGVQHFAGGRLGTLLLERGSVDEDNLGNTLALQHSCEYVAWRTLGDIPAVTIAALPAKFAIKHGAVPYERGENYLKVALRDPADLRILDELFFVTGRKVFAGVAPEVRIYQALEKYYGERRTPRFVILSEKLAREGRAARGVGAPPPPPEFFPNVSRRPSRTPAAQEIWGENAEPDFGASPIIESWKLPDQPSGGWAGTVSPGMKPQVPVEPESISWEELPQIPSLWVPETPPPAKAGTTTASASAPAAARPVQPLTKAAPTPRHKHEPTPAEPEPAPLEAGAPVKIRAAEPAHEPPPERPLPPPKVTPEPKALPATVVGEPIPPAAALKPAAEPIAQPPAPVPAAAKPAAVLPAKPARPSREKRVQPTAAPNDFQEVTQSTDRDSIAATALSALARRFDRGAIFAARPDAVAAWGVTGDVDMEKFRSIEIPWTEPSIFLNVRYSRTFYLGALPPLPRHMAFARVLGGWPEECVVYPVLIKDRPVAFLYAEFSRERGATPMDLAYLRELASAASSAFAAAIRLRKREI